MQAAMSVLGQLEQHRAESALETYRDLGHRVRQRVASFHSDLHLQGDRARLLQEETAAQLATATNKNLFALTVVTTFLLPPALVTGYFGMNTKNLLFSEFGEWNDLCDWPVHPGGALRLLSDPALSDVELAVAAREMGRTRRSSRRK